MTDRERIVEVMALQFATSAHWTLASVDPPDPGSNARHVAIDVLAALEAAGYAWYRPDDCTPVRQRDVTVDPEYSVYVRTHPTRASHRLVQVPVGGDS